jgi:hypothetical protein
MADRDIAPLMALVAVLCLVVLRVLQAPDRAVAAA